MKSAVETPEAKLELAKFELKTCEGCGGLWFRPQGKRGWKYCARCHARFQQMPRRGLKRKPGRGPRANGGAA